MSKWEIPPAQSGEDYQARVSELLPEGERQVPGQHVVSQVVLKGFAAPGPRGEGWRLTPYDLRRRSELKVRGPGGCGKTSHFLPFASASAEKLWNTVERRLDDAIRSARAGRLHGNGNHIEAIKDGIALHLVRSHRYLQVHRSAVPAAVDQVRNEVLATRRPLLIREFQRRYGLYPAGTDALGFLVDEAMSGWLDLEAIGALPRVSMEFMFERIRTVLRGLAIEVWHVPSGCELLISDSPAITFRYRSNNTLIEPNIALGDAHGVALPLAGDCLVAIGPAAKDEELVPDQVRLWNELQVRSGHEYAYYRPGSGLGSFVSSTLATM
jgi:hypothetical protein